MVNDFLESSKFTSLLVFSYPDDILTCFTFFTKCTFLSFSFSRQCFVVDKNRYWRSQPALAPLSRTLSPRLVSWHSCYACLSSRQALSLCFGLLRPRPNPSIPPHSLVQMLHACVKSTKIRGSHRPGQLAFTSTLSLKSLG